MAFCDNCKFTLPTFSNIFFLIYNKNIFCKSCGTVYANKLIQARDPACEHPGPEPDPDWGL